MTSHASDPAPQTIVAMKNELQVPDVQKLFWSCRYSVRQPVNSGLSALTRRACPA